MADDGGCEALPRGAQDAQNQAVEREPRGNERILFTMGYAEQDRLRESTDGPVSRERRQLRLQIPAVYDLLAKTCADCHEPPHDGFRRAGWQESLE
jgi:hypothetical protein